MRADAYLRSVRRWDAKINAKMREIERIRELATRITPTLSDMPKGGGGPGDKVGDAVAKLWDAERALDSLIDSYVDAKAEVNRLLENLPISEYTVMHMYYILGTGVEGIAEELERTERQVYRIKARGLKHVQTILDREQISQ